MGHDLAPQLTRAAGQPLGTLAMGPLLAEVLAIMRQHHLVLPADLALLLKTLAMTEGMAAQLDPSFHLMEALVPYARRLLLQQYSAHAWMTRLRKEVPDLIWLATELPHHVRQVLGELEEGTLTVRVQPAGVEPVLRRVERGANRVVLGVIVAALISGLTILLAAYHPGGSGRVLGTVFTLAAVVAAGPGLALARSIVRSERR